MHVDIFGFIPPCINSFLIICLASFKLNDIILIETRHKYAKNSCINLEQLAWSVKDNYNFDELKVKSELQIVMINNKNKVKRIKTVLSDPFFCNN